VLLASVALCVGVVANIVVVAAHHESHFACVRLELQNHVRRVYIGVQPCVEAKSCFFFICKASHASEVLVVCFSYVMHG